MQAKSSLVGVVFLVGLGFWAGTSVWKSGESVDPVPLAARAAADSTADFSPRELETIELFENASQSVVFVTSLSARRSRRSFRIESVPTGTGSGFLWDEAGHLVTNFHVVAGAQEWTVTLADRSTWPAVPVGSARDKDLAVLKIDAPAELVKPLVIGRSSGLRVGQSVFAIGNPFGLDQTLTSGIISALGREIESLANVPIVDVIQTDAAINPGNSGGPLLDSKGRLIGVNTAIASPSGASAGIGFAIPVDTVSWVVPDLIQYGKLQRPVLGVEVRQLQGEKGALVMRVTPGGGAAAAGLRPTEMDRYGRGIVGDLIVSIGDRPVATTADMLLALENYEPGDTVLVEVVRDDRVVKVPVMLGAPE